MKNDATVDATIRRVRAYAESRGWTKTRLAREADLNDTTLRDFEKPDWNPTADTLRRLEAVIPADFFAKTQPQPVAAEAQ